MNSILFIEHRHPFNFTDCFFVQNKKQRNNHYIIKQFKANPCIKNNNDKQIRNKLKEKQ